MCFNLKDWQQNLNGVSIKEKATKRDKIQFFVQFSVKRSKISTTNKMMACVCGATLRFKLITEHTKRRYAQTNFFNNDGVLIEKNFAFCTKTHGIHVCVNASSFQYECSIVPHNYNNHLSRII